MSIKIRLIEFQVIPQKYVPPLASASCPTEENPIDKEDVREQGVF
jgi:hypothetical protein